ncbi:MAG: hypothetical protein KAG96_01420 [Ichthyobacteriaceae bacterium]|nr:hypothetical protein [Ichthyobacteriaceae bacterium]
MQKLTIAFASDNGKDLTDEHFGEANEYLVYKISETESVEVISVKNIPLEEEMHADPRKAKGIAGILKPHNVQVVVNKAFGANIKRMSKKFVCIISKDDSIDDCIKSIQVKFSDVYAEFEKGEERKFLKF